MELSVDRGVARGGAVFPEVIGSLLGGGDVRLPQDLGGAPSVLCVAFYQSQSGVLRAWRDEFSADVDVDVLDVMVMPEFNPVYRLYVDNGLRIQTDTQDHANTATLYVDKKRFLRALGLVDDSRPYVLLLDGHGAVDWVSGVRFDVMSLLDRLGSM